MSVEDSQKALLNEYKGSLFEYLVAQNLANLTNLSASFYKNLSKNQLDIFEQQEMFVRNYFPNLLYDLPTLACKTAKTFLDKVELSDTTFSNITIVGKSLASDNSKDYSEADIVLSNKDIHYPISLKLAKLNSFVNTKSAGIKSFFTKYFTPFDVTLLQEEFNLLIDKEFSLMAMLMQSEYDIEFSESFKHWEAHELPVLPGQLNDNLKTILHAYYEKLNSYVYLSLKDLYALNPTLFLECIKSLMGHSKDDLIHLTSFYDYDQQGLIKSKIVMHKLDKKLELMEFKKKNNSFDIIFKSVQLQLRIKPMNKFTSKSYKINCAVKYLSS